MLLNLREILEPAVKDNFAVGGFNVTESTMFKAIVEEAQYREAPAIIRAKDFLINTDYSVEMIGQAVGYTNLSSFSRVFKEQAGCSPIQYRRRHTD